MHILFVNQKQLEVISVVTFRFLFSSTQYNWYRINKRKQVTSSLGPK